MLLVLAAVVGTVLGTSVITVGQHSAAEIAPHVYMNRILCEGRTCGDNGPAFLQCLSDAIHALWCFADMHARQVKSCKYMFAAESGDLLFDLSFEDTHPELYTPFLCAEGEIRVPTDFDTPHKCVLGSPEYPTDKDALHAPECVYPGGMIVVNDEQSLVVL